MYADDALIRALYQTVNALSVAIAERDTYTSQHQNGTATIARVLSEILGMDIEMRKGLRVAATLHDVGKIAVPTAILNKPAKLSPAEMDLVRQHPEAGYRILEGVEFPWPVAEIVLQHHERLDGSGYPRGLAGDDILVEARVIAVADTIESMLCDRPYRRGASPKIVIAELEAHRGSTLDAAVVDAALPMLAGKKKALERLSRAEVRSPAIAKLFES